MRSEIRNGGIYVIKSKLKKLNIPLILGSMIVLLLLIIVFFGGEMTSHNPYAVNLATHLYKDGEMIVVKPQMPPNPANVMGTDVLGRDIFSCILAGAKITFTLALLTTLFKFIVSLPIAFFAGFGGKISSKIIKFFSKSFSAIPALIVSILLLKLWFFQSFDLNPSTIVFALVMTFVSWGRLSAILKDRVEDILSKDFFEGEVAIGKSKFLIAVQNVLPHLTATIIIHLFLEMGRSLVLIAQLGVFEVYVGRNGLDPAMIYENPPVGFGLDFMPNYHPEWGAMLSASRYAIMAGKMWIVLFPVAAFFVSVIGFSLVGEGLKIEINKRTSRVITWLRKVPFHLSPKTFFYEIRNYKSSKIPLAIKTSIICIILVILLIPPPKSLYYLDTESVFSHIEELAKEKYEGRKLDTKGRDEAAEYISSTLEEMGIRPFFENGYVQELSSRNEFIQLRKSKIQVKDSSNNMLLELQYGKDYTIDTLYYLMNEISEYSLTSWIVTEEEYYSEDYLNIERPDNVVEGGDDTLEFLVEHYNTDLLRTYRNPVFVYVDDPGFNFSKLNGISKARNVIGVIAPTDDESKLNNMYGYRTEGFYRLYGRYSRANIIYVSRDVGNSIKRLMEENQKCMLSLENNMSFKDYMNYKNIGVVIKGKDRQKQEGETDKLIIATNYDYFGNEYERDNKGLLYNGSSVGTVIEIARKLNEIEEKPNLDIVFLFFDGSKFFGKTGADMYVNKIGHAIDDDFAITLNNLGSKQSDTLYIDTSRASTQNPNYFQYVKYIQKRAGELGIKMQEEPLIECYEDINRLGKFGGKGILIESINNRQQQDLDFSEQKNLEIIDKDALEKQGQLLLDAIVHIAYD